MNEELKVLFAKINTTADFGYVNFADINTTNALGESALHIAVRWGDIDAVRLLIASGIDVNKPGEEGYTPLHYACSYAHEEIAKLLLDSGANPFARTEGDMPFTLARLHSQDRLCDLLSSYMRDSPFKSESTTHSKHMTALAGEVEILQKRIEEECGEGS